MNRIWMVALSALLLIGLTVETAEAKRFGGGSSFGSKPSHSQPHKSEALPDSKPQSPGQSTAAPTQAATPTSAPAPKRGFSGMLGGLLMGGLLGALFFGGAFDHINFMDVLVFAALAIAAFFIFRQFFARRSSPQYAGATNYQNAPIPTAPYTHAAQPTPMSHQGVSPTLSLPRGFDVQNFLDEAKRTHALLHKAWDDGELSEIRGLTTDKVFGEVQDQYRARSGENRTEVNQLHAQVLTATDTGDAIEASVLFDSEIAEYDANSPVLVRAERVREVWHFVRSKTSLRSTWLLDGIQQIEGN